MARRGAGPAAAPPIADAGLTPMVLTPTLTGYVARGFLGVTATMLAALTGFLKA